MINLPNCLKSTIPCLYADVDDTQIFTSSHDTAKIAGSLNSDLENITDWLTVNKLQYHPNKTKMMVMGSRYNLNLKVSDLRSNIRINNNVVLSVFSQKCLGIYRDERLAFDAHIEDLSKKFVLVLVFSEELNPLFLKSVFLNYINP